uniref:Uncharacterized protein n=1 Tax=Arundo donax TaxID=35708 RepID=A0A0A9C7H7_ARUDO
MAPPCIIYVCSMYAYMQQLSIKSTPPNTSQDLSPSASKQQIRPQRP